MKKLSKIEFNTEIWKENGMYIAYIPQLDISSCGKNMEEAKKNIKEATEAFLEESNKMGNLKQILREAGFVFKEEWKAPAIIAFERMKLAF